MKLYVVLSTLTIRIICALVAKKDSPVAASISIEATNVRRTSYIQRANTIIRRCKLRDAYDPCNSFRRDGVLLHQYRNGKCKERCVVFRFQLLRTAGWNCGACADTALPAIYATGSQNSSDLEILNCTENSVEVRGSLAVNYTSKNNFLLIYLNEDDVSCSRCNWLFRYVKSVAIGPTGQTIILSTRAAKVGEVLGSVATQDVRTKNIETLLPCTNDRRTVKQTTSYTTTPAVLEVPNDDRGFIGVQSVSEPNQPRVQGSCKSAWLEIDDQGQCKHTNCYVGVNGDPAACFECKDSCDNGCGAAGSIFNTDGRFSGFDFGPACCNHDHCWSTSSYSKMQCDDRFYGDLRQACPDASQDTAVALISPLLSCRILSIVFYTLVSLAESPYKSAQEVQSKYNGNPTCCGNVDFMSNEICCQGTIYNKENNYACCGNGYIDLQFQKCCNGKIIVPIDQCCNANERRCEPVPAPCVSGCCPGEAPCGDKCYNTTSHVCCVDQVYIKVDSYVCCGSSRYDIARSHCCNGKVFPYFQCCNGNDRYCGPAPGQCATGCCPGQIFDCGTCYDPEVYKCCGGVFYSRTNNYYCCRTSYISAGTPCVN